MPATTALVSSPYTRLTYYFQPTIFALVFVGCKFSQFLVGNPISASHIVFLLRFVYFLLLSLSLPLFGRQEDEKKLFVFGWTLRNVYICCRWFNFRVRSSQCYVLCHMSYGLELCDTEKSATITQCTSATTAPIRRPNTQYTRTLAKLKIEMIGAFSERDPYDVRRSRCFSARKVIQIVSMSIHSMAPALAELFLPARLWIVRLLRLSFVGLLPITILECLPRPPDTKWIECRGNDGGYKVSAFQWNCRCTLYTRFASTKIFNLIKNRLSSFLLSLCSASAFVVDCSSKHLIFGFRHHIRTPFKLNRLSHSLTLCVRSESFTWNMRGVSVDGVGWASTFR